ncbi:MAG TPA: ribosome biogenesis GTPase YlqF [Burkholderiaceae bacterium]|jgi:ribosome biogenesis GTPase A|nr:ribosome biogenesis GTPase YlqF [Burkholderiaceae bacterium]
MSIQWFPGHMNLTRQAIAARLKAGIDVVIELLDARLPGSSANPLIAQLARGKPSLKVLNKQDMADPVRTEAWLEHYRARASTNALALDASEAAPARRLIPACRDLAPGRGGLAKPMRVLIVGVPNAGKSTLVNTLVGRKAAKTGDEAGITRREDRIVLADDFYLYDTPGMLWPRIAVPQSGQNLAAAGSIGRNAYDDETVALDLLAYLKRAYPDRLTERYGVAPGGMSECEDEVLLTAIGRRLGALAGGGRVDMQVAAERLIHDFRQMALGRITLETPKQFASWERAAREADAEHRQARLAARSK